MKDHGRKQYPAGNRALASNSLESAGEYKLCYISVFCDEKSMSIPQALKI